MFFSTKFATVLAALVASAATVSAAVSPRITSPKAGDVWTVGSVQTISWDTTGIPEGQTSIAFLGFIDALNPLGGENLDVDHPLAQGFPLTAGSVQVTVPQAQDRNDYIVALGGSNNISPMFTIAH